MAGPSANYDTLYEIDQRYQLSETDIKLSQNYEHFGRRMIGVAIVGVGRMGAIHLYNVLREPRAQIKYVMDADRTRLDYFDKKYFLSQRGIKVLHTDSWQEVLQDKSVEAVLISTPTSSHMHYVQTALEHDKHIMCEKPLAEKIEEIDTLVNLAQKRNLKLVCALNRRYDPSFRKIHQQIQRGDIGDVRIIKTCCRDSPTPAIEFIKTSAGVFHDCCVHDVDLIMMYANELPIEVHAYGHAFIPAYGAVDDYDTTVFSMKFKSGILAVTDYSRVGPSGYEQRVEVFGPKGVLKVDEFSPVGWEKHTEVGVNRPSQCFSFASRFHESYAAEVVELFNHIEGNKTMYPIMPGHLQALCKVINAVEKSARTGQAIKLEWTQAEIDAALPKKA